MSGYTKTDGEECVADGESHNEEEEEEENGGESSEETATQNSSLLAIGLVGLVSSLI